MHLVAARLVYGTLAGSTTPLRWVTLPPFVGTTYSQYWGEWGRIYCPHSNSKRPLKEPGQLAGGLVLRNHVQLFEGRSEGVAETPHRSRLEILMVRIEVQVMDFPVEMSGNFELRLDERAVDYHL